MRAALTTAILIGLGGLGYASVLGFGAAGSADLLRHTTVAIFATLITLLAHSMTMFYLLGKGRAIREAAAEGGLPPTFYAAVARARGPVFGLGMPAMGLTMAAAANLALLRAELTAMRVASDTVRDVDALLAPRSAGGG